jgi:phosphoserine phosphatase
MTTTGNRPFAAFDIDGTLIRWQLYHAIVDELGRRNHIAPELHQKIIEARKTWQSRQHSTSFKDYEETLVAVYHQALTDLSSRVYQNAVDTVFETY